MVSSKSIAHNLTDSLTDRCDWGNL